MNAPSHLLLTAILLAAVTAGASITPVLDDIIRGLTLGGGLGTLIAYRRYQRTGRNPFILIPLDDGRRGFRPAVGAELSGTMSGMRITKRTWLALLVAAVLGVPSMLLASSIGATGWAVTLAGLPAMLIGSLGDRDWFYGPRDPSA